MSPKLSLVVSLAVLLLVCPAAHSQISIPHHAVPFIDLPLSPEVVVPGGSPFVLTVNGGGFDIFSVVYWNGIPLPTIFISKAELKAIVLPILIANPGTAAITVTNPVPGGGTSAPAYLEITTPNANLVFSTAKYSASSFTQTRMLEADLRGNGTLDLISYTQVKIDGLDNAIHVLLGNGDGTFQIGVPYTVATYNDNLLSSVVVGDFNGDGKLDVAVSLGNENGGPNQPLTILLGNGDGTFQAPITGINQAGGLTLLAADVNHDGRLDLISATSSGYQVFLGNGDGTFIAGFSYTLPSNLSLVEIALADFNKDGVADIATVASDAFTGALDLQTFQGSPDGTFATPVTIATIPPSDGASATGLILADYNGDGKQDIAFGFQACPIRCNPPVLDVFLGNGDGTFQAPVQTANLGGGVLGDFDGDGKLDFTSGGLFFFGNGDGTFTQSAISAPPGPEVAGDFNGDGRLDLAGPAGFPAGFVLVALQQ